MVKSDVYALFELIAAAYPRDKAYIAADEPTARVWTAMLANVTVKQAQLALMAHIASSEWPPTVHDILKACTGKMLPDADEAWGMATDARRKYGWNGAKEAKAVLPPEVWETTRMLYGSWEDFCTSPLDEQTAARAHFFKLWEARERRETADRVMLAAGSKRKEIGA